MKTSRLFVRAALAYVLLSTAGLQGAESAPAISQNRPSHIFNILDYGAVGDGVTLDSEAINRCVRDCSEAGGGQVLVPPGRYLSGTVHLRSHVTLYLSAGATLLGTTNLSLYQQPDIPGDMPEARWGKWHRALLVAQSAEDITIAGPGVINGNKVFDPTGEEHMRGPHALDFVACRGFKLRDCSIIDAANYAIFFQVSDDVDIRNVTIIGGWDGVHFRGSPHRWCRNVNISNCRFYTGDDSIAGRYWDNVVISGCTLNSSCNGIRLIGPATRLLVQGCLFYGPGQQPHRSSARFNMLAGIILQPGAWDRTEGLLDNVFLADNTMRDVAAPVTLWTKRGNPVGRIEISGLNATGIYRSALSVESWADAPITNLVVRNAALEFTGGGRAEQGTQEVKGPGVDPRPLPAWGLYARNVETLTVQDVRLSLAQADFRPVIKVENANLLELDSCKFTHVKDVTLPLVTTNVAKVELRDTDLSEAKSPAR